MKLRYIKDVVTLKAIPEKCKRCGMCLEVCPRDVFAMGDKSIAIADRDACMECGACSRNCPFGALEVRAGVGCAYAILYSKDGNCCG